MVPWRFDFEMSFLLPSLDTKKNTQSNVHKEENLEGTGEGRDRNAHLRNIGRPEQHYS